MNEALKFTMAEQFENMSREEAIHILERLLLDVVVQRAEDALDDFVAGLKHPESQFNPYTARYTKQIKAIMRGDAASGDDQQSKVADNQVVMHLLILLGKDPTVLTTGR